MTQAWAGQQPRKGAGAGMGCWQVCVLDTGPEHLEGRRAINCDAEDLGRSSWGHGNSTGTCSA